MSVTILIPTLRRPESLARTLRSVFAQEGLAELAAEIVVVDNAPEASARETVDALRAVSPVALVYVHAAQPGVSTARNAGLAVATGEHVAFIDDDEGAHPDWLRSLVAVHAAFDADVTFGPVRGQALDAKPSERPYLDRFFSRLKTAPSGLLPSTDGCGCGNSLMRRATALMGSAPFDVEADALGGEDDRLFAKLGARGGRFAWAADAWVDEYAPAHRATARYALTRAFLFGQGPPRICMRRAPPDRRGMLRWMAVGAGQVAVYGPSALALRLAGRERWLDVMDKAAQGAGKVLWTLQLKIYGASASTGRPPKPAGRARRVATATKITQMKSL